MKHWRKRLLCIFCALVMMVSIIQIPVSASTTPSTVTVAQAEARLNTLISKFKDKYFTVNGTYCTVGSHSSEHDNCLMSKVVATSWVKNLVGMGSLDPSLFPAQYNYDGSKWSVDGWQCYGFANFAHWYIFSQKNTDNLVSTLVTKGAMTYTTLKKALPGDVIRTDWLGGHSMVFVSCDSSGFTVLDCNYKDSATGNYACQVKVHKVSYNSGYSVGITGVSNYDRSSKTIAVTGVSVSPTQVSLDKGNTYTLSASASPTNATNKAVTWSSNNTAVATVSSAGVVTGVGPGTATITATTKDGGYKSTCTVTVSGDVYTITYDLNGGIWGQPNTQTKNEGQDLILVDEAPIRPGYTFLGWESSNAIVTEGEWVTEKPAEGDFETGYKYYTYGYEYDSDYTYAYGANKNTVWSSSLGTYSAAKLRYFWLIESTNHGESFFPAKTGNTASDFKAPYISETGVTGTATIRNTNFYFESVVYKQDLIDYPVYQPGETLKRDENATLSAIWMEGMGDSTIPMGNTGDCYWRLENGTLTISGNGAMGNYSASSPAPWDEFRKDIATIIIKDGVTSIGDYSFCGCINTTSVLLANSITYIGNSAFSALRKLTTITLPNNLNNIESSGFYECESLSNVFIPASVSYMHPNVFRSCHSLTEITVDPNNTYYSSHDGVLYDETTKTLICYPEKKPDPTYTVPDGIKIIDEDSFCSNDNITSVILPDSVKFIRFFAFRLCENLTDITIGKGLSTIETQAFLGCYSLRDVWYNGSEADRENIYIDISGNGSLLNSSWHYAETDEELVPDDRLTGIELIALPDKVNYKAYYYLELDGAVLRLHFADGEHEDIILNRPFSYLNNRGYYYSEHLQEIFTVSLSNTRYKVAGNYTASVLAFGHKATFGVTVEELNETYTITNLKNSYARDTADDNVLIIEALQEDGSVVKMTILGYEMPNLAPGILITDQGVISGCFDIKDSWLSLSLHFDGDPDSGYGYTCGTSNSVGSYNYYTALMYANKIRESWRGDDHYSGTITKANIDGIVETVILLDDADFATSYSGSYIRSIIQKYFGIEADLSLSEKYNASTDVYNGGPWYGDASGATKYQMPIMLQYHLFGDHGIPDWEYTYEFYDHWNNTLVVSQEISIKFDFYKTISEYHRSHPIFNANYGELEIYTTQSNVRPNQTFDVYLRLTAPIIANKLNIGTTSILYDTPLWDTESLELIDYEWLLDDTILTNWNTDTQSGMATFQENIVIDGSVMKLTFRVKESAMAGPTHVGAVIRGYAMDGNTEDFHLSSERFTSVTVDLINSMIVRKGSTLEYTDLIYVKHVFDLVDIDLTKVDLSKDAGILYWTQEEFVALDGIIYDPDHALVGLSLYPGTNFYYGRSEGIFTRDLAEERYYVGYVKLPDGTYIYSEPLLYGPQTYAYNMLGKDTTSQKTKQLCVALLNYIAAAQKYFYSDIADSELANAGLTAEQKAINWTNVPENFTLAGEIPENKKVVADKSVFTRSGKNLRFQEMISLISVYQISDSVLANAEESGTIFWTAEQFAALNGTPSIDNIGSGQKIIMESYGSANMWCSVAPEVAAKDMADTSYYILGYVKHRDGTVSYSDVMSYSFEQYIYNKVTDIETSTEMLEFAKRLYVYEREARNALK